MAQCGGRGWMWSSCGIAVRYAFSGGFQVSEGGRAVVDFERFGNVAGLPVIWCDFVSGV